MLTIDRTSIATGDPVSMNELQEHMRLDADLVAGAYAYIHAATARASWKPAAAPNGLR